MTYESTNKNSHGPICIPRGRAKQGRGLGYSHAGFTLLEVLVYIAILATVVLVISSFLIWAVRTNTKNKVMAETLDNARRTMEIMVYEIKEAESIYTLTSVFETDPGQLSLETKKYLPVGETSTYIDFYLCENHLCLKKESQDTLSLTSDRVEVKNLIFNRIITNNIPSIQIDLKVDYKGITGRPEYQASVSLRSVVSLRSY